MTAVPEESGHTHDRRYSQRNHRHDDRYVMKLEQPRFRVRFNDVTVPNGGSEMILTSLHTTYTMKGFTFSNGVFTAQESGIYVFGCGFRTNRAPTGEQRSLFTAFADNYWPYRFGFSRSEAYGSFAPAFGLSAGGTVDFRVYQNTGAAATYSLIFINAAKISEL